MKTLTFTALLVTVFVAATEPRALPLLVAVGVFLSVFNWGEVDPAMDVDSVNRGING